MYATNIRLTAILNHACSNVSRYELLKGSSNLSNFPITTRVDVQCDVNSFLDKKYVNQTCNLLAKASSGSSGQPVVTYWRQDNYIRSMHTLWNKRRQYYGILPYSKKLDFTLESTEEPLFEINKSGISASRKILEYPQRVCQLFDVVEQVQIDWIYIQPYVARCITRILNSNKKYIPTCIKYIEFVGEILSQSTRKEVEELFNCQTANMYGSEEMNGIAFECPYHHMHVLNDNVYVETEFADGGRIYLTGLHNYAMPLIRYEQGDVISIHRNVTCKCGYCGDNIDIIKGRSYEQLENNISSMLNPYTLITVMEALNPIVNNCILEYRFRHIKATNDLVLFITLKSDNLIVHEQIKLILFEHLLKYSFLNRLKNIVISKDLFSQQKYSPLEII